MTEYDEVLLLELEAKHLLWVQRMLAPEVSSEDE